LLFDVLWYHRFVLLRRAAIHVSKWYGPIVAVGLAIAWWVGGTTWFIHVGPGDWRVTAAGGVVAIAYEPGSIAQAEQITGVPVPKGLRSIPAAGPRMWWFFFAWEPNRKTLAVPLWFPIAITLGLSALAWRIDLAARRRARIGCCPKCSYNRTGLPAASPCPECGASGGVASM
jgi:hypothetical protein